MVAFAEAAVEEVEDGLHDRVGEGKGKNREQQPDRESPPSIQHEGAGYV